MTKFKITKTDEHERLKILRHNQAAREKRAPVRRLEEGEVVFKIPPSDYRVLTRVYPKLVSKDHAERLQAWKDLRHSPVGEQYLVTRTPRQVKRSPGGIIVK